MRLKEVAEDEGYVLNKILPTMFALRKDEKIVGVMISNVDDLLYGNLRTSNRLGSETDKARIIISCIQIAIHSWQRMHKGHQRM